MLNGQRKPWIEAWDGGILAPVYKGNGPLLSALVLGSAGGAVRTGEAPDLRVESRQVWGLS
jgi:hypothetical protein